MVLARARHYLQTFGSDPLSYLPRDDAGRPVLRVLAFESMAGGFSGGGQYLASSGTGVFLFSRQDKDGFGHTSAHEIFHAYNDTALAMAQGPPNVWWGEGFTDALAHLTHLRLSVTDPDQRAQRVRMLISEAFGRYSGIGGPPGPDGQPQGPKPLPAMPLIGADPQAYPEVYADHELYDRLVQQRPLLLMLRAATLMAKGGTPRPAEAWFTAALRAHGQHRDGAAAYSFESLRDLALAQAGNARDELAQFFSTYFEGTTQVDAASARAWAGDPAVAALVR